VKYLELLAKVYSLITGNMYIAVDIKIASRHYYELY